MKVAVVTAIVGPYDSLKEPALTPPGVDFYAFTTVEPGQMSAWRHVPVDRSGDLTDRRVARRHKVLAHRYVPRTYDAIVWVDGSMRLVGDPREACEHFLRDRHIAVRKHPWRNPQCAYTEARACMEQHKDDPQVLADQVARYLAEGYPSGHGMVDTAFLLRRCSQTAERFSETWWEEITRGSCRDQVSFNYTSWATRIPYQQMPNNQKRSDGFVRYMGHGRRA